MHWPSRIPPQLLGRIDADFSDINIFKPKSELTDTEKLIIAAPRNLYVLAQHFEQKYGLAKREAGAVAHAFANKATHQSNVQRSLDIGITHGIWMYSGAGRDPCPHESLDGVQFDIRVGALFEERYISPGAEPGCMCFTRSIIPGLGREYALEKEPTNMALTTCHECGAKISTEARACPQCGAPLKPAKAASKDLRGTQIIAILAAVFGIPIGLVALLKSVPEGPDCAKGDLMCYGKAAEIDAAVYCQQPIERLAKYQVKWVDGVSTAPRFSRYRWLNRDANKITMIGDQAQFQNGFGAFMPVIYECDLGPDRKTVLDVRAWEGKLQ